MFLLSYDTIDIVYLAILFTEFSVISFWESLQVPHWLTEILSQIGDVHLHS